MFVASLIPLCVKLPILWAAVPAPGRVLFVTSQIISSVFCVYRAALLSPERLLVFPEGSACSSPLFTLSHLISCPLCADDSLPILSNQGLPCELQHHFHKESLGTTHAVSAAGPNHLLFQPTAHSLKALSLYTG